MKYKYLQMFGTLLVLVVLVLAAFPLQRILPPAFWLVYPVVFLGLAATLFSALCQVIGTWVDDRSSVRVWAGYVWTGLMFPLYSLSSINRPAEIRSYFARHHPALDETLRLFARGDTASADSLLGSLHMKRSWSIKTPEAMQFQLYRFAGYGYRLVYSRAIFLDTTQRSLRKSLGGYGVRQQVILGRDWLYYSYAD